MTDKSKLMRYAIDYLSKFSSSKKNLERILKGKIMRLKIEKKDKPELYDSIPEIILKLEINKFINDENYTLSKIRILAQQGKSKAFIKNYLFQKGIEKDIISESLSEYENINSDWEIDSANVFMRKKRIIKSDANYQKNLNKMARAGFNYSISSKILKSS
jgi:SOS response regulatory protein OraA/RecX